MVAGGVKRYLATVIASEREATQLMQRHISAVFPSRFIFHHQLGCFAFARNDGCGCFAFVTQNDSQDRFVCFAKRSSPRNDGF